MGYADYFYSDYPFAWMSMFQGLSLIIDTIGWIFSLAMYLLLGFGLYTIARRRGLNNAWLSFVPVGNIWILGSISDQYHYVTNGAIRNRRKLLIGLDIVLLVVSVIMTVGAFFLVAFLLVFAESPGLSDDEAFMGMMITVVPLFLLLAAVWVIAILQSVFCYMCYYDLFKSCDPEKKVLYLVLGILFNLTPLFVFLCRNKDLGMPPMRDPSEIY